MHAFGFGGNPNTSSGWASFYIEDMVGHAQACQAQLTSMVIEGVFERLPRLRFVLIEGGFGWLPSLAWRLDRAWKRCATRRRICAAALGIHPRAGLAHHPADGGA